MAIGNLSLYNYISSTGVVIPDTSSVKTAVENEFKSIFGNDINLTEETKIGRLVESLTMMFRTVIGINAQNMNQINPNLATGIFLDAIGALFGVSRLPSTRTTVSVLLYGTSGTFIPANSVLMNEEDDTFYVAADTTIGTNGTATANAVSDRIGIVGTNINRVISAINGLSSVETIDVVSIGDDAETDAHFRTRIQESMAHGTANIESIYNAIYASDSNVSSVGVLENGKGTPVVKSGVFLPPHSIFVCAYGGDPTKISTAIYETKTAGAIIVDDFSYGTRIDNTINGYYIPFYRPVEVTDIPVAVYAHKYLASSDPTSDIKSAIVQYIRNKGIGGELISSEAIDFVLNSVSSVRINGIEFNGSSTFLLPAYQIGIEDAANISVTYL